MIYNELNTGFRWYDSLDKQTRFKEYCSQLCDYGLMAPCNDMLPFQIRTDSMGQPTGWLLKYLDGTMEVPTVVVAGVKASKIWGSLTIVGTSNVMIIDLDNPFFDVAIGRADWDTDLDTTMAKLVLSINTNTNYGTVWGFGAAPVFDNSTGYTATYNSSTKAITIYAPVTGTLYNGRMIQFAVDGGTWGGDAGYAFALAGGVDEVIEDVATDTVDISDCIPNLTQYTADSRNYIQY